MDEVLNGWPFVACQEAEGCDVAKNLTRSRAGNIRPITTCRKLASEMIGNYPSAERTDCPIRDFSRFVTEQTAEVENA